MPVTLVPPAAKHRDEFLAACRRSRSLHRPWIKPPGDAEAYAAYLKRLRGERHAGWFATVDGELLGVFNVNEIVRGVFQSGYLGYYAFTPHAGTGRFTDAMRLVLRRIFTELRLHRVEANIQPDNERSIRLVRRCGFQLEGVSPRYLKIGGRWRDHERWAITVEGWRTGRRTA